MKWASALPVALLIAAALAPALAQGAEDHSAHGSTGPANPMVKAVTLYLDGSGGLVTAPPAVGNVPAGTATPDGTSTAVLWAIEATRNTKLDSSIYVELFANVDQPTIVAGHPESAAFKLQLALNGEPVEGAASVQKLDTNILAPGTPIRMKVFLPESDVELKPGDTLGLLVNFYGLNPEGQPALHYVVGGDAGSRMVFRLRMASLGELDLPKEVNGWPVAPLEGFDFDAAKKANPGARVVNLKAFQFGFRGAPITVPNGTKVILQMTVDESLSTAGEGHAGHGHDEGAPAVPWDQNTVTALHGFTLGALDPKLTTVLFDGLVTSMTFTADKPGNYTFLCTVFCGSGHGGMLDRLTVEGPPPEIELGEVGEQQAGASDPAKVPGPEAALLLAAAGLLALALGRRRRA